MELTVPEVQVALVAWAVVIVVVVRFELFCLRDLAETRDEQLRFLTRRGWFAVIILSIPLGGLVYLSAGKWR